MKKFLFMILASSMLFTCACSNISMENNESELSKRDENTVIVDESKTESTPSEQESQVTSTPESIIDDSSNASEVVDTPNTTESTTDDSSNASEVVDTSNTTESTADDSSNASDVIVDDPDYTVDYAVELTEEELNCINAGSDGSYLLLVNKENKLPDYFEPENLVDIRKTRSDRAPEKMVYTAEMALNAFLKEATYYGYGDVTITSGYRSIAKQETLFNYYVSQEMASGKDRASAEAAAAVYSAYPGTSEHHTGLCADMHNLPAASQSFGSTEAAKWMAANAHRFGFILRFPQGKQDITGYMWEPWHFRFVGRYHATIIYENGLTLEEYHSAETEVG